RYSGHVSLIIDVALSALDNYD
ncbi:MAG: hypothetical protein RLZZ293_497, partial [Pseudomonadota bacterium]